MDRQEFLDLGAPYALGLLAEPDRRRYEKALEEARVAADAELLRAHAEALETAAHLSLAAPEPGPESALSPLVFDRILDRVRGSSPGSMPSPLAGRKETSAKARTPSPVQAPAASPASARAVPPVQARPLSPVETPKAAPRPRIAWIFPWNLSPVQTASIAIGCVLLSVTLLLYAFSLRNRLGENREALAQTHAHLEETRSDLAQSRGRIEALEDSLAQKEALLAVIRSRQMQVVVLQGQDAHPAGYGKVIWDPERKQALLHISNLPPEPADRDYQLWVIRDQKPVDAGIFQVQAQKEGGDLFRIEHLAETDKAHINAFAVTLEPKGGVPQPTGKMVLLGSLQI